MHNFHHMERQSSVKEKGTKGVILKTLERCRSFGHGRTKVMATPPPSKTKSWPRSSEKPRTVAPEGYFTVYIGPGKERFVIKTECVNHPLFGELLDEAETVYGYNRGGPLELPCDVDDFHQVLWDIQQEMENPPRRSFTRSSSGYRKLVLNSRLVIGGRS